MKSTKETALLVIIIGAALWAAFVFFRPQEPNLASSESPAPQEALPATETAVAPSTTPTNLEALPNAVAPSGSPGFGPRLKEIGQCLGIGNSLNDNVPPSMEELQSSLRNALGEMSEPQVEYENIELETSSGEKRFIRISIDNDAEHGLHRRLQYYSADVEGNQTDIPISPEQEINPTDSFIAGLEADGTVTLREKARRGSYGSNGDVYFVERNDKLFEVEINYQGKSVRCQDLDKPQSSCSCF